MKDITKVILSSALLKHKLAIKDEDKTYCGDTPQLH